MNIYNKSQSTYAKFNHVVKDSSCDTPLPKILIIAILATCENSSSTKRIICNAHTKKRNTIHVFTHRFVLIFQSTFELAYSRSKKVFSRLIMGLSAK
ncbi:hypothetical protein H5410_001796, partial [Solanum commersonii]